MRISYWLFLRLIKINHLQDKKDLGYSGPLTKDVCPYMIYEFPQHRGKRSNSCHQIAMFVNEWSAGEALSLRKIQLGDNGRVSLVLSELKIQLYYYIKCNRSCASIKRYITQYDMLQFYISVMVTKISVDV